MGKEVVYCSKCGQRLREEDFRLGRGFIILNRYSCADCKDAQIASLSAVEREQYEKAAALPKETTPVPPPGKEKAPSSSAKLRPVTSNVPIMNPPNADSSAKRAATKPDSSAANPLPPPPAVEPAPRARTEPLPKADGGVNKKTPSPGRLRRPGQTSRPYAVAGQKKGGLPPAAWIGILLLVVAAVVALVIILNQSGKGKTGRKDLKEPFRNVRMLPERHDSGHRQLRFLHL
jgi:hypothetical protein